MRQSINLVVAIVLVTGLALLTRGQMDLYDRLSALDTHLVRLDTRLGDGGETRIVYREAAARTRTPSITSTDTTQLSARINAPTEVVPVPVLEAEQTSAMAAEITDRGYMYAKDWENMEANLSAMSEAENKQFWEEIFKAIESGSLEVYDE